MAHVHELGTAVETNEGLGIASVKVVPVGLASECNVASTISAVVTRRETPKPPSPVTRASINWLGWATFALKAIDLIGKGLGAWFAAAQRKLVGQS